MSDGGYTLVEMLAALAILGLAMTGVAESAHALKAIQDATASDFGRDAGLSGAMRALNRLLTAEGPFRSDDPAGLTGDARRFSFDCGAAAPCVAELAAVGREIRLMVRDRRGWTARVSLTGLQNAHFLYSDLDGPERVWPPKTEHRRTLDEVVLATDLAEGTQPVVAQRMWGQQHSRCAFDPIIEDCREPGQ